MNKLCIYKHICPNLWEMLSSLSGWLGNDHVGAIDLCQISLTNVMWLFG